MNRLILGLISLGMTGIAMAKLPALSDEEKAQAAETKNKAAWSDKVAAYKLCLAQDKVAAHYRKTKSAEPASPATATSPQSANPGPTAPGTVAASPAVSAPSATSAAPAAASLNPSAAPTVTASAAPSPAPIVIPPCQEPGPYVSAQATEKVGVADSLPVPAAGKAPTPTEAKK